MSKGKVISNRLLKKAIFTDCSKMPRCKVPEILRCEANLATPQRRRMRETPQMAFLQQPVKERVVNDGEKNTNFDWEAWAGRA